MKYADIIKYVQAGNPGCSPEMLEALAKDRVDRIRLRVAENPATPIDILELLATDKNVDVRIAVGTNPSTPAHISYGLAFDSDANVRLGLAEDLNTPIELLDKLRQDLNPYVSCRAEQTKELIVAQGQLQPPTCHRFFRWATKGGDQPELRYA